MSLTCLHLFLTFNLLFGIRLNVKKDKIAFKRILRMSSTPDYSNLAPESTPILDTVNFPRDLKRLDMKQLKQVFIYYHQLILFIFIFILIFTIIAIISVISRVAMGNYKISIKNWGPFGITINMIIYI